jgi:HSP20 family protein
MATTEKKTSHPAPFSGTWNNPIGRFFRNDFTNFWNNGPDTVPSVNIREEKDRYSVEMAAPGLKKEDINVDVEGNLLTISCENEEEIKGEETDYSHREYNYTSFSRSLTLPENADSEKISARYADGVLRLGIPKRENHHKNNASKIRID